MPEYIVTGTKVTKDGRTRTIRETATSNTKAQWIRAQYTADGYKVQINEKEKGV